MRLLMAILALAAVSVAAPPDNLPPDCCIAAHIDLAALSKTEIYKQFAEPLAAGLIGGEQDYADFCQRTGFKLEDLASITIGLAGDDIDDPDIFAVVRGKLDAAKFEAFLTADGEYAVERKEGMTLLTAEEEGEIAFVEGAMLVSSVRGGAAKLLAAADPAAPRSALLKLLDGSEAAHVSCSVLGTPAVRKSLAEDPDCATIAGLTSMVIRVTATDKFKVSFAMKAGNDGTGIEPRPGEDGNSLEASLELTYETAMPLLLGLMHEGGPGGEPCGEEEAEPEPEPEPEEPEEDPFD